MSASVTDVTLAVLGVLNLALLLGVVRRLNDLAVRSGPVAADDRGDELPPPGTKVGDFRAVDAGGRPLSRGDLRGRTLVGFFAVGCPPCAEFAPVFRDHAATFPGGRDRALAVVVGAGVDPPALVDLLRPAAQVVVEPAGGPVATAFGVDAFPSVCVLQDTVVLAAGFTLESVELPGVAAPGPGPARV